MHPALREAATRRMMPPGSGSRFIVEPGDTMDQPTFHAWYETVPEDFKAELLQGLVYMPAAARNPHAKNHGLVTLWLGYYMANTPGVAMNVEPTVVLGPEDEPQPDVILRIEGGQTDINADDYIVGPPELVVEIAASSRTYDLHAKKRAYEAAGVLEYMVVVVGETPQVVWFDRTEAGQIVQRASQENGIFDSRVFPGLRLDSIAFFRNDALLVLNTLQAALSEPPHAEFVAKLANRTPPAK